MDDPRGSAESGTRAVGKTGDPAACTGRGNAAGHPGGSTQTSMISFAALASVFGLQRAVAGALGGGVGPDSTDALLPLPFLEVAGRAEAAGVHPGRHMAA